MTAFANASDVPARIATAIDRLLQARRADATICPSEVARTLVGDDGDWRAWMPAIRDVAASMAEAGRLRVTRNGNEVDARSPGGPIRLGVVRKPPSEPVRCVDGDRAS